MSTERYRVRWIFPVAAPPLENGVLEVSEGSVSAIHNRADPAADDLGNVALFPGLVNAHTHLEFSEIPRPLKPAKPFTDWIRAVVSHRRSRMGSVQSIIEQGVTESLRAGTRAIGEIATEGWSPEALRQADSVGPPGSNQKCRTVVFREILGLQPEQFADQLAIAKEHLQSPSPEEPARIERGLSPHAPYSVHPDLYHQAVSLCRQMQAPLAMHLAETQAELEFLSQGRGEFVEMLSEFGVWREGMIPKGVRIRDYLEPLAELPRALIVHGNYLGDEEIAFLAGQPQLSVVYCPRTHAYFGQGPHPWPKLLAAGVRVVLGTDSRASNPDLNLWEEVKFLRRKYPHVPPEQWIRWATRDGAVALYGLKTSLGILAVGGPAQFAVVPLEQPDATDPYRALFGEV